MLMRTAAANRRRRWRCADLAELLTGRTPQCTAKTAPPFLSFLKGKKRAKPCSASAPQSIHCAPRPRGSRRAPRAARAPKSRRRGARCKSAPPPPIAAPPCASAPARRAPLADGRSEDYYQIKTTIFSALIDTIDLAQLAQLDPDSAREEIRDIVNEIISIKAVVMSIAEQEHLLQDICNDVLGYGPLEPLLARDDIADIMVNGAGRVFIEVGGKVQLTNIRFRDNAQLMNICQRIVSQVGRRVDESSPICDARLLDGSPRQRHRAAAVAGRPHAHHPQIPQGQADARRSRQVRLDQRRRARACCGVIGRSRCNVLISGGTGSGKTTLLNCMTAYIDAEERIITCEDAAELQLQQPHVVRLETRPPNLEGQGQITMRDLVRNCLRMRPERIIVGEVRGPEAFDLLAGHEHRP